MNYILSQINRKIEFYKSTNNKTALKVHYQSKFEFYLIFMLSYFWNKNYERIDDSEREYVVNCILKPSVGTIISLIRTLDCDNVVFGNRKLRKVEQQINQYPHFRNERIGHGYSFEDDVESHIHFFENLFNTIKTTETEILTSECDIIKVLSRDDYHYSGIRYSSDGNNYVLWTCPRAKSEFNIDDIYLMTNNGEYIRLSPFLHIQDEDEFYSFVSVEEKLSGRTKYNRLVKTGTFLKDNTEFEKLSISVDRIKRRTANGTIVNNFENNYKKYIDTGITKYILSFLKENKSSVFATLWGHGGVGKTASIQRIIEIISNQETKIFDYIIFISAKDRYYNYYKGEVISAPSTIVSLNDILTNINTIVFNDSNHSPAQITKYMGKLLIVIDDFETFSKDEKGKIVQFIKSLDINHHKIILTTRAATLITGEEIQTKELTINETRKFFIESFKSEFPNLPSDLFESELADDSIKNEVFRITSGRPLFILQLMIFSAEKGAIKHALNVEINRSKAAINFLYDRLYDYLSLNGKNMFLSISLLVDENDLTGLIENLRFVLNLENKEEEFQNALNELVKLKIIDIQDADFYKVYSTEIYALMKEYYNSKGEEYDGSITSRYQLITTEKELSVESALLKNADASRLTLTETEVENKYRYILNREASPLKIKLRAIKNFGAYLSGTKGKPEKAISLFKAYEHLFMTDADFIFIYSSIAWSVGTIESKQAAIEIIKNFLLPAPRMSKDVYLELISLLMMYEGILVIEERTELKEKMRYKEISKQRYLDNYNEQKIRLASLFNYPGHKLYQLMKSLHLNVLKPRTRNYVLDGLIQYIEICIRNNKYQHAIDVCDKVELELSQDYHTPFKIRRARIFNIANGKIQKEPTGALTNNNPTTLLGLKLREAFKNNSKP
ncbi:MAG: hypothetical protein JNL72_03470 [Flavipsychrobacter sp.]|nr:hypothetical protein [Flavipsychrobacter sp.]